VKREKLKRLYKLSISIGKTSIKYEFFSNNWLFIVDLCIFASHVFVFVFFLRKEGNIIKYPFASGINGKASGTPMYLA